MKKKDGAPPPLAVNKSAGRDYEILERHEAGLSLVGSEVKSIRGGGASIKEAYIQVRDAELFLLNCTIAPYSFARVEDQQGNRERKLLMHRREIERLGTMIRQKGLTLVPLKMYLKAGRIKLELGVGRGKKHYDKREDTKEREVRRSLDRVMKRNMKP